MGILDIMQIGIQAMQIDPGVGKRIDLHEALKQLSRIRGVSIIRQDDEVDAMNQQEQQQMQRMQQMEAIPAMAGAVKDVAQAQAVGKK